MSKDYYIKHIESCDKCIEIQEIIECLEKHSNDCMKEKGVIRNNIIHHYKEDKCRKCDIIDELINKLQAKQEGCIMNSYSYDEGD